MAGPGVTVDPTGASPAPVGSLVNSAAVSPTGTPSEWSGGIQFAPETCVVGRVYDYCAPGTSTIAAAPAVVSLTPYVVEVGYKCSSLGWKANDYQSKARRALLRNESAQIEKELWLGTLATAQTWDNPFFVDTGFTRLETLRGDANDTAYGLVSAFAGLENALFDQTGGERGMIHVSPLLANFLVAVGLVTVQGNILVSALGTVVVAGVGYPGSSPTGSAETKTHSWAFATDMVTVWRGDIEVLPGELSQALEKTQNTITFRAQRFAAATFGGCARIAARFSLCDEYC